MRKQDVSPYWQLVKTVWDEISIYDGPEAFLAEFNKAPVEVGNLFAAHWTVSEIYNGAIPQFFYNNTGVLAPEAVVGFKSIGLVKSADALSQAMKMLGDEYPRDKELRIKEIEKTWVWGEEMTEKGEVFLDELLELSGIITDEAGKNKLEFEKLADVYAVEFNKKAPPK